MSYSAFTLQIKGKTIESQREILRSAQNDMGLNVILNVSSVILNSSSVILNSSSVILSEAKDLSDIEAKDLSDIEALKGAGPFSTACAILFT